MTVTRGFGGITAEDEAAPSVTTIFIASSALCPAPDQVSPHKAELVRPDQTHDQDDEQPPSHGDQDHVVVVERPMEGRRTGEADVSEIQRYAYLYDGHAAFMKGEARAGGKLK